MIERSALAALMFLPLAAGATAPKIHPRVLERAQSEPVIPVFIVLEHQPQREILARAESANALYRQVAESRYRQAPGAEARVAAEGVLLRTRRQAFQAIEQAIGPQQDALESRLRGLGAARISRYLGINMLAAEVPASAIAALEADPAIARVFPVDKQYPQLATSVPALGAPAFWSAGYTGQGESVGVLDTGVRTNHPAFAGVSIVSQVFLANGGTDPCFADSATSGEDQQGHGTHVAGIVASQGSAGWTNYQGVAKGIGTLYNLKVGYKLLVLASCDPVGAESDPRDVLAALDWAVRNTALRIFNYSYGSPTTMEDDVYTQSIDQYIENFGLVFAIAAGNGGPGGYTVSSPGFAYNSITVGNWVSRGVMNDSSSRGPTYYNRFKPDLAAPGTNILSTAYNWDAHSGTSDDFVSHTGTSMAAPHIAGAAALIESAGVTNPLAVKAILINTADSAGAWAPDAGWGYANLNTALGQLNYATGTLATNEPQLYRVSASGAASATVVWNGHFNGVSAYLNDIALHLYAADTGVELASSTTTNQNVQRVSATHTGDVLLWATKTTNVPLGSGSVEPYAVAFSGPGSLIHASNPSIHLACTLPPSVASGTQFLVSCGVTNSGGLPAAATAGTATLSDGVSSPVPASFGSIGPGSVGSGAFSLRAPYIAGTYALSIGVSTAAFLGSSDSNSLTVTVQQTLPQAVLVAPGNGVVSVSQTPTLTWSPVVGAASYDVYLDTSVPPALAGTTSGTSFTSAALSPGTLYYWRIAANNGGGSSSSATWSFTTQGSASGQTPYVLATVAGTGGPCNFSGDGGPAINADLCPSDVAQDAAGNLFIADGGNRRVREVTTDGMIATVAGTGACSWPIYVGDGGPAKNAEICAPSGVALDAAGYLYIADGFGNRVRKVDRNGIISTVAGTGDYGFSGDGGPATSATFRAPGPIAFDAAGNLYIVERDENRVRKVDAHGIITTFAGTGTSGYSGDGGPAAGAGLWEPASVAADGAGNLYIADLRNNRVRKVAPNGVITTVAGNGDMGHAGDGGPATSAQVCNPSAVTVDAAGNLYIADQCYGRVREVTSDGKIATVAGSGNPSDWTYWAAGPATSIPLLAPAGITIGPSGRLYIADGWRDVIRVMRPADPSCQSQISQSAFMVSGDGATFPLSLGTGPACVWGAVGLPAWIGVTASGPPLGIGPGNFNLVVAANSGAVRHATISIGGAAVEVMQGAGSCAYALTTGSATATAAGGPATVGVTTGPGCLWTASGTSDWVTLTAPGPGIGSGSVSFTVARNTGDPRSITLTIAGLSFNIRQAGTWGFGLGFVPVAPCRVADTRFAGPSLAAAQARSFAIPQSACGIPSTAHAYSLNVTVVPKGPLYFLTLWPTGQDQPVASTLNSWGGIVAANAAIVPAGSDGAVCVYASNPTDVILDINGYFDSPGSYAFYPVQPCRVADTRGAAGPFGGPSLTGGQTRDFPVASSPCGMPSNASAYSMNVTVVPDGYLGFLSTWPTGQAQPNVSTLNSWTGKVVANAALVPAGNSGSVSVFALDATDVILDTNGYFGTPGNAGALNFYPVSPCRVADTRWPSGPFGGPELAAATPRSFPIPTSGCGIPTTAAAYSLNVTVVPDGLLQFLTAWPTGAALPVASTLNSWDGAVVANAAIVPAGAGGEISVYASDPTHVILDINGYFAP